MYIVTQVVFDEYDFFQLFKGRCNRLFYALYTPLPSVKKIILNESLKVKKIVKVCVSFYKMKNCVHIYVLNVHRTCQHFKIGFKSVYIGVGEVITGTEEVKYSFLTPSLTLGW